MNSLFSKCYPKNFSNVLRLVQKRNFSSTSANHLVNLSCSYVVNAEDKETLSKLVEKDVDYFVKLSENSGAEEALKKLAHISEKLDASTKLGRELINTKNEIVKRLVFYNRSIEDHENMSNHICEKELYQVYAEHLKQLEERVSKTALLKSKSAEGSRLIYEYQQSLYSSKYVLSPLLIFGVPSALTLKYSLHLKLLLGTSTPLIVVLGSLYAAVCRYKWLTSNSYIKDGNIAKKVSLEGNSLKIESLELFSMKTYTLDLNSVKIHFVENEARRETYYLIRDVNSKKTFILPLDDKAVADRKLINWLSTAKSEDNYSISSTISKGNTLINLQAHRGVKSEIDKYARLHLLSQLNPGLDLSTLTSNELHEKLNSISDIEVKNHLEHVNNQVESLKPAIESALVEVENFLVSLGLSSEEAVNTTKYLRKNLRIEGVSDLKNLSTNELTEALNKNSKKSSSELDLLVKEIQLFFRKF